ncbi:hypothetical protein Tco_0306185, partial [Tanacetum coccineum]
GPRTPNDDNDLKAQAQNDGSNSSQSNSPTIDHFEDDVGHPQSCNCYANENKMAATSEHDSALCEGNDANILETKHVQNVFNQPLRRSERSSFFPNKYNEYVVDSKVKYGLE